MPSFCNPTADCGPITAESARPKAVFAPWSSAEANEPTSSHPPLSAAGARTGGPEDLPSSWAFCAFVNLTCCFYRAPGIRLDSGSGGSGGKGKTTPSWTEAVAPANEGPMGALMTRQAMARRLLLSLGLKPDAVSRTTARSGPGRPVEGGDHCCGRGCRRHSR